MQSQKDDCIRVRSAEHNQSVNNALLQEQSNYYRARAAEYDDWWFRRGRYDRGPEHNARWFAEADSVRRALVSMGRFAQAVELACGTGLWTEHLARLCQRVTALEASAEMIELNRARVRAANVSYVEQDLFAWTPRPAEFDLAFAGFWFSHVPPARLGQFLEKVRHALRPGGRLFIVDSLYESTSTARDHVLGRKEQHWQLRRLSDGREFRVVKVFYEPDALARTLAEEGFDASVTTTGEFFLQAIGTRR